jgi:hypothetical protein
MDMTPADTIRYPAVHTIPSSHKHCRIRWSERGEYIVVTERGLFWYRGTHRLEAFRQADHVDKEWKNG